MSRLSDTSSGSSQEAWQDGSDKFGSSQRVKELAVYPLDRPSAGVGLPCLRVVCVTQAQVRTLRWLPVVGHGHGHVEELEPQLWASDANGPVAAVRDELGHGVLAPPGGSWR